MFDVEMVLKGLNDLGHYAGFGKRSNTFIDYVGSLNDNN